MCNFVRITLCELHIINFIYATCSMEKLAKLASRGEPKDAGTSFCAKLLHTSQRLHSASLSAKPPYGSDSLSRALRISTAISQDSGTESSCFFPLGRGKQPPRLEQLISAFIAPAILGELSNSKKVIIFAE